jgi:hypothetical protein
MFAYLAGSIPEAKWVERWAENLLRFAKDHKITPENVPMPK